MPKGSARDHVETEWAEATEGIPGRRTANIPQKKRNDKSPALSRAQLHPERVVPKLAGKRAALGEKSTPKEE